MATLKQLFDSYGVDCQESGHRHVRKGWIGVDCPHCSPGWRKYRLGFELATGRVSCWVCGLIPGAKALATVLRISEDEARSTWKQVSKKDFSQVKSTSRKPLGKLVVPDGVGDFEKPHRRYLKDRGFRPSVISSVWGVRGIGMFGRLRWRLYIPIFDPLGKMQISWTTRSLDPSATLRYVSAKPDEEVSSLKEVLYGAHLAQHVAIISEGPIDVWSWGPGGVGTLGLTYTESQLNEMVQFPVRAVCFDSQPDALRRADKLANKLSAFPGRTEMIELESGKDANEVLVNEPAELEEVRKFLGLE